MIIFWGIFTFVSVCFTIILFAYPFCHDDWWYLGEMLYFGADGNGHHDLWTGIKECVTAHYATDNSRIGNTIGIFMVLLPTWLTSTIKSFVIILSFWFMTKVSGIKVGEYGKLILLFFLIVFGIAWEEHMFSTMYSFNYLVIIPIFLYGANIFLNKTSFPIWEAVIIGLLIGAWHECYAVTLLGGGAVVLLFRIIPYSKERLALLISIAFGMIWLFAFPGAVQRANDHLDFTYLINIITVFVIIIIIFCLILIKSKFLRKNPTFVIGVVSFLMLMPLVLVVHNLRIIFPSLILIYCSVVIIASGWMPGFMKAKSIFSKTVFGILFIIISGHLVAVCYDTIRLNDSVKSIIRQISLTPKEEKIYVEDMFLPKDYSILSLNRPNFNGIENYRFISYIFGRTNPYVLLPKELEEYSDELGVSLGDSKNLKTWNGFIISNDISDSNRSRITFKRRLINEIVHAYSIPFIGKDGKTYVWVFPSMTKKAKLFGNPEEVYLN